MSSDSDTSTQDLSSVESSDYENDSDSVDNLNLLGKTLKNYNIICELGRGAFSIVWLAYDINTKKYYAIKVQNPKQYGAGLMEIDTVKKLPSKSDYFNTIIDNFTENYNNKKYLCSIWNLHASDIDTIIRKINNRNGFKLSTVKRIMKQLINAIYILHTKLKIIHCDIKTDNILIKGVNDINNHIINKYNESNFDEKYLKGKEYFWKSKGKDLKDINQMKKDQKNKIRGIVHEEITNNILKDIENINKYSVNEKYINNINVCLADFGSHCTEDEEYYSNSFGTRYYQAPEIILFGECSYPIDIWALGCTFYELLSGKLLFDPIKDSKYSRDYYHLLLINDTCGKFSSKFLKTTQYYKKYFDKNYELIDHEMNYTRLDRKLNEIDNINETERNEIKRILKRMLDINPNTRIKINELIKETLFL